VKCEDGAIIEFCISDETLATEIVYEFMGDQQTIIRNYGAEFTRQLNDPDPFVFIIKGHLYIEALINAIINGAFLEPSQLELDYMSFDRKVKLCVAAGIIPIEVGRVINKLNQIRNKFAHNLWPSITNKDERDLLNVFCQSEILKNEIPPNHEKDTKLVIWVLYFYLLGQLFKTAENQKMLFNFWISMVDANEDNLNARKIVLHNEVPINLVIKEK
jgi:hypothetical protein